MDVRVHCYARPVRFELGAHAYNVVDVVDQWYGPDDDFFKVRAHDGNVYILRRNRTDGKWSLESFRRTR